MFLLEQIICKYDYICAYAFPCAYMPGYICFARASTGFAQHCLTVLIAEKQDTQLRYTFHAYMSASESMPTRGHAGMRACTCACIYACIRVCMAHMCVRVTFCMSTALCVCVCLGMHVRTYKCLWGIAAIHPLTMDGCLYPCMYAYACITTQI